MMTVDVLKSLAYRAGFDLCGVTDPALIPAATGAFHAWLEKGYQGEMAWIARDPVRRTDPRRVMPNVRSVIMLGVNYYQGEAPSCPTGHGRVSSYAWGEDYHDVIERRSTHLIELIGVQLGEREKGEMRAYVDYGPVLERSYAIHAGLGYLGKNAMLINRRFGSWVFLSAILTSLEFAREQAHQENHGRCGECTRCIDACPTGAIVSDGVIDSRLCISYLTIERPTDIPASLRTKMGDWLFGCDICQDVCPHNGRAEVTRHTEFSGENGVGSAIPLGSVLAIESESAFRARFEGTPLTRPGLENLKRNARIVEANQNEAMSSSHRPIARSNHEV